MLNAIISFSIRNKLIIGMLTIGLVLWGSYSLKQLPIDAVPDITNIRCKYLRYRPRWLPLKSSDWSRFP